MKGLHLISNPNNNPKGLKPNIDIDQEFMKEEIFIDKAEQQIIESYENGEWKSIPSKDQDVYINAAKKSHSKT